MITQSLFLDFLIVLGGFFCLCTVLGLYAPTAFYFVVGFVLCLASVSLAIRVDSIELSYFSATGMSRGDVYIISAIGFGFGLLIFASGSITNGIRRFRSVPSPDNEKVVSIMSEPPAPASPKHSEVLLDIVREHIRLLVDPFAGSNSKGEPIPVTMRVAAALSGAFAFHASIGLYPYLFSAARILRDFSILGFALSSAVSAFWIIFCGLLYAKYDRSADFAHVFRSSFLFSVLIYLTGKLAHVLLTSIMT